MPMTDEAMRQWAEQIRGGDVRAVSRAITAVENKAPEAEQILRELFPETGRAYTIGVTGAPGTGKSTLIDRLAAGYRRRGETVGIIAIDSTSPFTGGAILGDRIRMQGHAGDRGIYIRSMATRGFMGGVARATADAALLLDAAGKQTILIETVGVGQDEVEVGRLVDCTLVVLIPGLGDDVQNLKAGLMEIADLFVLNKADQEGADQFEQQLRAMLAIAPPREAWRPPVVRTVATEGKGIDELTNGIAHFREFCSARGRSDFRQRDHWKRRLVELLADRLVEQVVGERLGPAALDELAAEVAARRKDPYAAVEEVLARAGMAQR
jgi:LAO/AO transport system kinase